MSGKANKQRGGASGKAKKQRGAGSRKPETEKRYPMPCPGCREMIDARDKLCPHCGIDTDAKLAPFRLVFTIVAIGIAALVASQLTCCKGREASAPRATTSDAGPAEPAREVEPNDTVEQAMPIEPKSQVRGAVAAGERDLYRLELAGSGGLRVHAGLDDAAPAGLRVAVLDAAGERRGEAVAPGRLGALGVVPGTYVVAVEAGSAAGEYTLSVDAAAAGNGVEWEPNDELANASPLMPLRAAGAGEADEAKLLGATAGRGWWSSEGDRDCYALPAGLRGGFELVVEVQPPPAVAARIAVWDAPAEDSDERRLLAASEGSAVGEAHRVSVGSWGWKPPMVACVSAVSGADFGAPYRLEVQAYEPKDGDAIEIEPNDETRVAQHVPPEVSVRGHLADGDVDRFVLEPRPEGDLAVSLAPRAGHRARLSLLDVDERELARAEAGDDGSATAKARGVVYVVVGSPTDEATEAAKPASESSYALELATASTKPDKKKARKACRADAKHCCLEDGRVVRPGGCQPSYPPNVQPATRRGVDGRCVHIKCTLKCLPATARIATPRGAVEVSSLAVGDSVWTVDADGARVAAPLLRVEARPVLGMHSVVELELADGRVVRASAGHPTAAGDELGDLSVDDVLDGARVVARRVLPYEGAHTWDILPAGATGQYWSDGVLIGSTLR